MTRSDPPAVLAAGNFVRLVRAGHWEYVERVRGTGAVAILAITAEDRVLLVEQFRPAVGRPVIELPAGIVGDLAEMSAESFLEAAARELLEETGYAAGAMRLLTAGPPTAGLASEIITFLRAENLTRETAGGGDGTERITVHEIPLAEIDAWLAARAAGDALVAPTVYTGLYFARI